MDTQTSARLGLPFLINGQALKYITHNHALDRLDRLVHASCASDSVMSPTDAPEPGVIYIVPEGSDWPQEAGSLVLWEGDGWSTIPPSSGLIVYIEDRGALAVCEGQSWRDVLVQNSSTLGVNASADAANPLTVAGPGTLFTHEGSDHRLSLNKANATDTASVVFKTGYSGRAEFGTVGSDHFALKVSPDGQSFADALRVNPDTARLFAPQGLRIGVDDARHELSYEDGDWVPALGSLANNDFAGATGLNVAYGRYTKVGRLVTAVCCFTLTGLTSTTFTTQSCVHIMGLPFDSYDDGGNVDQFGVSGMIYQAIGATTNSAVMGAVTAPRSFYMLNSFTGDSEARNTDPIYLRITYMSPE